MNKTSLGYAVSGAQWKTQFIPSDGLGRLYEVKYYTLQMENCRCKNAYLYLFVVIRDP